MQSVLDDLHAEGVALADFLDEVEALRHLSKARVVAVEVGGVLTVVDDEELGASGVSACVGHAQHTFVVVLVVAVKLAVDGVSRSTTSNALRASTLGHKPWNHAVKLQSLVKALLGELDEVRDRVGRVFLKKLHGHRAVVGVNLGVHAAKMHHPRTKKEPPMIGRLLSKKNSQEESECQFVCNACVGLGRFWLFLSGIGRLSLSCKRDLEEVRGTLDSQFLKFLDKCHVILP